MHAGSGWCKHHVAAESIIEKSIIVPVLEGAYWIRGWVWSSANCGSVHSNSLQKIKVSWEALFLPRLVSYHLRAVQLSPSRLWGVASQTVHHPVVIRRCRTLRDKLGVGKQRVVLHCLIRYGWGLLSFRVHCKTGVDYVLEVSVARWVLILNRNFGFLGVNLLWEASLSLLQSLLLKHLELQLSSIVPFILVWHQIIELMRLLRHGCKRLWIVGHAHSAWSQIRAQSSSSALWTQPFLAECFVDYFLFHEHLLSFTPEIHLLNSFLETDNRCILAWLTLSPEEQWRVGQWVELILLSHLKLDGLISDCWINLHCPCCWAAAGGRPGWRRVHSMRSGCFSCFRGASLKEQTFLVSFCQRSYLRGDSFCLSWCPWLSSLLPWLRRIPLSGAITDWGSSFCG